MAGDRRGPPAGPGEWGFGPSAVFRTMHGPWVVGSLFSQVWSCTDDGDETVVSLFTWQFLFPRGIRRGALLRRS